MRSRALRATSRRPSPARRPSSACTAPARRASARTSPTTPPTTRCCRRPGPSCPWPASGRWAPSATTSRRSTCGLLRPSARPRACTACGPMSRRRSTSRCARRARRCTPRSGRESRPVRFVVSLRLGEPPTLDPVARAPGALPVAALQARPHHRVDARDHRRAWWPRARSTRSTSRAYTSGTIVDQAADPVLYRRVVEAFPDAWIEDPKLDRGDRRDPPPPSRPHHLGRAHPRRRGHRGPALPAADGQRQAVAPGHAALAVRRL